MGANDHSINGNACAKCGACTAVCPVYGVTGAEALTARGRLHLLDKASGAKRSRHHLDIFSKCLLCGACLHACPRGIDLPERVVANRRRFSASAGQGALFRALARKCLPNQGIMAGIGRILEISAPLLERLPADSGLRLKLGLPGPEKAPETVPAKPGAQESSTDEKAETMLFSGCYARYLDRTISDSTAELVGRDQKEAVRLPTDQGCCGLAFYSGGDLKKARRLARLNIGVFEKSEAPIVVPCGSCFAHLTAYPKLLADDGKWHPRALAFAGRLRELSAFLTDRRSLPDPGPDTPPPILKKRAVYHDPCHLRYLPGLTEPPRQLLGKLPWLELIEPPEPAKCCGFGGLFSLAHPDISERIAANAAENILAVNPDLVITTCSGCLIQLRRQLAGTGKIRVLHLAQVLNRKSISTLQKSPSQL